MAKRDYYEVLTVTRTSTEVEITKAYRKLAMLHHPDRNVGDAEAEVRFKEVTEAYEVLRDPQKRAVYDRYGHAGPQGGAGGGQGVDLGDLFGDLFGGLFGGGAGGRRQRGGPRAGRDVQDVIVIDLIEAATGVEKAQILRTEEHCDSCHGTGAKPGTKPTTCKRCGGQGAVLLNQGFISVQQTCRSCEGRGQIITDPCGGCRGRGRVETSKTVTFKIDPGVDTGIRYRIAGAGDAGDPGAPRGDVVFLIQVRDHKFFRRDGHNLECRCPVSFSQAALGGPIEITTLTGQKVVYELPRGTQTQEVFRVFGHGMPNPRGGRKGDLLVEVMVETPTNLTPEQEDLLRKLAETTKTSVSDPRKGFFGKLKDLLGGDAPPSGGERPA